MPAQSHGKSTIEIGGIVLSASILAVIAVPTCARSSISPTPPTVRLTVNVTGQQWWWEYSYPVQDGLETPIVTSGELVIPTGQCVLLRITSRDVIHSFWIPKLNGKKDAVPGRIHTLRMEADEPGIFAGQCTEFCGLSHANMKQDVVALERRRLRHVGLTNQLAAGRARPPEDSPAAEGEAVFVPAVRALPSGERARRCRRQSADLPGRGLPRGRRGAEPDPPDEPHDLRRRDVQPPDDRACRADLLAASPEEFGPMYLAGVSPECLNRIELEEWVRNAPVKKPMYPTPNADGLGRGMPYLGLSEERRRQAR